MLALCVRLTDVGMLVRTMGYTEVIGDGAMQEVRRQAGRKMSDVRR